MSDAPRFIWAWGSGHMRKWSDVCPVDGPGFGNSKQYMDADAALAQTESLQRENAALRDVLDRRGNLSKYVDSGNLLVEQEAAAITPEMRDRIGAHRARLENPNTQLRQWTLAADQIFSDLLGEQG